MCITSASRLAFYQSNFLLILLLERPLDGVVVSVHKIEPGVAKESAGMNLIFLRPKIFRGLLTTDVTCVGTADFCPPHRNTTTSLKACDFYLFPPPPQATLMGNGAAWDPLILATHKGIIH